MEQQSTNSSNHTFVPLSSNRGVLVLQATGKPKVPISTQNGMSNQGVATLVVMCCVLGIIMMFCCLAAPGIRDLCKRYVLRQCAAEDAEANNVQTSQQSATPTLILLPFGRMLVVDRTMFQALQTDTTGLDFFELSRHVISNQSFITGSTPSILDFDSTSKGLTPDSLDLLPPAYDDIFNKDLPPAYSELSLLFRTTTRYPESASAQSLEMRQIQETLDTETGVTEM